MLPGLQRFKKSPMKAADANLIKGASRVAQADIDATVSKKTGLETALELGVNEANRQLRNYGEDYQVDASQYGYTTDDQIKENLDAKVWDYYLYYYLFVLQVTHR